VYVHAPGEMHSFNTAEHKLLQLPAKFDGNLRTLFKLVAKKLLVYFFCRHGV